MKRVSTSFWRPSRLLKDPVTMDSSRRTFLNRSFERELDGLEFVGLISISRTVDGAQVGVELTKEGERVAKALEEERQVIIRPKPSLRTTVFVACAFGYEEIDQLYNEAFASACEKLNYNPVRIDLSEPTRTITDAIMDSITEAACVVADLTYARPSVYFEVGYAHGLGIPLLLTCRKDHHRGTGDSARIHFDLEQYKISFWKRTAEGAFSWDKKSMRPDKRLAALVPPREQES